MKPDECYEAAQPAEKTELQRALDALANAENMTGQMLEAHQAAEKTRAMAAEAVYLTQKAVCRAKMEVTDRQCEVSRLSRQ